MVQSGDDSIETAWTLGGKSIETAAAMGGHIDRERRAAIGGRVDSNNANGCAVIPGGGVNRDNNLAIEGGDWGAGSTTSR